MFQKDEKDLPLNAVGQEIYIEERKLQALVAQLSEQKRQRPKPDGSKTDEGVVIKHAKSKEADGKQKPTRRSFKMN